MMTAETFPSPIRAHRRADMLVHMLGSSLILLAGGLLIFAAPTPLSGGLAVAAAVYLAAAAASNMASWAYHFGPWHADRQRLRRVDHAAIYPSITGTFTPFFVFADTTWTLSLMVICWTLTIVAMWNKITNETVKARWSTASYLGVGALGLGALPDLGGAPLMALWCILAGSACYVIGTAFYARKAMPFRYAIWHLWVNFGASFMFVGVWLTLFHAA